MCKLVCNCCGHPKALKKASERRRLKAQLHWLPSKSFPGRRGFPLHLCRRLFAGMLHIPGPTFLASWPRTWRPWGPTFPGVEHSCHSWSAVCLGCLVTFLPLFHVPWAVRSLLGARGQPASPSDHMIKETRDIAVVSSVRVPNLAPSTLPQKAIFILCLPIDNCVYVCVAYFQLRPLKENKICWWCSFIKNTSPSPTHSCKHNSQVYRKCQCPQGCILEKQGTLSILYLLVSNDLTTWKHILEINCA